VLLPAALPTVKLTVYFPAAVYLCVVFCLAEVVPSPKFHFHEVGEPVLVSLKVTVNGAFPEVGFAEKFATGFAITFV
jgi:hypothetical protein